jgi:hypothetical protein
VTPGPAAGPPAPRFPGARAGGPAPRHAGPPRRRASAVLTLAFLRRGPGARNSGAPRPAPAAPGPAAIEAAFFTFRDTGKCRHPYIEAIWQSWEHEGWICITCADFLTRRPRRSFTMTRTQEGLAV